VIASMGRVLDETLELVLPQHRFLFLLGADCSFVYVGVCSACVGFDSFRKDSICSVSVPFEFNKVSPN
jgi:hypothetical protein